MSDEDYEIPDKYLEFWYANNPKLNIVRAKDFMSSSVSAQKDREETEDAKHRVQAFSSNTSTPKKP